MNKWNQKRESMRITMKQIIIDLRINQGFKLLFNNKVFLAY